VLTPRVPIARDLVLAGGGHSHAIVARMLGMRGLPPGVRVTLVSDRSLAP
jgi:selenide,water dikinase